MELEFIDRVIKGTLFLGIIAFAGLSFYANFIYALGIVVGSVWGSVNLFLIKSLIITCFKDFTSNYLKILILFFVKLPVIYLIGYGLLIVFPMTSLAIGFSLLFLALFGLTIRLLIFQKLKSEEESNN